MSVRNIDLVTFENDSVLNQKSISLPVGKVSIRQTVILFAGILVTFLVFLTTDNLIVSGLIFAVFLGLGLIGSKAMSLDQMIKSHLILLIRGTSLDVKPDYMEKKKKNRDIVNNDTNESKTRLQRLEEEHQQNNNNGLVNKIISEIQSLFSKKNYPINQNQSKEKKNFSAEIQLDQKNILNVSLFKNKKQTDEPINKPLRKLSKENLTEHVTISLDGKELEKSQYEIKSNNMISLTLDNNSYEVTATSDDNKKQNPILKN
ncbi:hypothetical protein [Nitrosopumilus sp.]|uniref:hypothetical protein n=1 Tax=Nitrosopumilus sp. TaxID=2024843 RepID=UPI0029307DCB|nr:hypothetical protein [Nitrosopumilus sp.]